jgi:Transposase IS66 family
MRRIRPDAPGASAGPIEFEGTHPVASGTEACRRRGGRISSPNSIRIRFSASELAKGRVVEPESAGAEHGHSNCDRDGTYKKRARQHPGIVLAFCWAHQRRDRLLLGNDHPEPKAYAMQWVEQISQLYPTHGSRAAATMDRREYVELGARLRRVVQGMAEQWAGLARQTSSHSRRMSALARSSAGVPPNTI